MWSARWVCRVVAAVALAGAASTWGATRVASDVAQLRLAVVAARADCERMPEHSSALCRDTAARRLDNYLAFRESLLQEDLEDRAALAGASQLSKRAQLQCSKWNPRACEQARRLRLLEAELASRVAAHAKSMAEALRRVETALRTGAQTFRRRSRTQVVCALRDLGAVDCSPLAAILAHHDNRFATLILRDIDRIHEVDSIDERMEVLIGCGPGLWGAIDLASVDAAAASAVSALAAARSAVQGADRLRKVCEQLASGGAAPSRPDPTAAGFSGLTGFDRLGGLGGCGGAVAAAPGSGFIEAAMQLTDKLRQTCSTGIQGTVAAGGEEPPTPPPPSPKPEDPPPPPDPPKPDDRQVAKQESEQKKITDSNGNPVTVVVTVTTYTDGTVVTQTAIKDDTTGKTSGTILTKHADGSRTLTMYGPTDDGGTRYDQTHIGTHGTSWSAGWQWDKKVKYRDWLYSGNCAGEPCSQCGGMSAFYEGLTSSCLGSGGKSLACRNYSATSACCLGSANAFAGNPRVAMPNPEGDLTCVGPVVDSELKEGACKKRCSVASSEAACTAACTNPQATRPERTVLDRVCDAALWDACFTTGGWEVPSFGPARGGPQPPPAGVLLPADPRRPRF